MKYKIPACASQYFVNAGMTAVKKGMTEGTQNSSSMTEGLTPLQKTTETTSFIEQVFKKKA